MPWSGRWISVMSPLPNCPGRKDPQLTSLWDELMKEALDLSVLQILSAGSLSKHLAHRFNRAEALGFFFLTRIFPADQILK